MRMIGNQAAMLSVVLVLAGCSASESPDSDGVSPPSVADVSGLDEEMADRFTEARREQQEVLASTAPMVGDPTRAGVDELEAALIRLNSALRQSRAEINRLRADGGEDKRKLIRELRADNVRIQEAFSTLLEHHPGPSADILGLMAE